LFFNIGEPQILAVLGQKLHGQVLVKGFSSDHLGGFGIPGIGDGQFQFPNGVAADDRLRVYVTDTGNDRVQVWSY